MVEKTALEGLRVIDFSNVRTGAQTSQLFADFGAEVIHVEPRGGSPLRSEAAWPFWARGKRSIQLNLKDSDDLATAQKLAGGADVVIETLRPGVADRIGIGYEELSAKNPGLVYASITGFGRHGPLADLQGYEGIIGAKFGTFSAVSGLAARPGPSFLSAAYASYPASQLAIQGILAALYEREESGVGQWVETSLAQGLTVHDTLGWFLEVVTARFSEGLEQTKRAPDGIPAGGLSFRLLIALTKDGKWLQFSQTTDRLFKAMMELFELDWMFDDPEWNMLPEFEDIDKRVEYWERLLKIVRTKTAAEWLEAFDRHPDVWGELFRKDNELLDHPQMQWNHMVANLDDRDLGKLRSPGPLTHLRETPAQIDRPAPRLGEHDDDIKALAVIAADTTARAANNNTPKGAMPLEGITVIELGTYYAAPYATTLLLEMGARVIKLEQPDGDPHRNMLPFPEIAGLKVLQGKESVAIELHTDKGREIAYRIIRDADIVLQSFRAGVAVRLKLDADALHAINPDLVYLSAPGYGEDGPCGHRPAFAPTIGAGEGLAWRNAGPIIPESAELTLDEIKPAAMQLATAVMGVGNSDGISAVSAASAMMLALLARRRGAGGQSLLTTMLSSSAHCISEIMMDYEGQPGVATADLELHGFSALYRLYETSNEWVFLAAPSEREWSRLVAALAEGARLAADPRFTTAAARQSNDDALAGELAKVFLTRGAADWEKNLRAANIACVEVATGSVASNYMNEGSAGQLCGLVTTGHHPMLDEVPRLTPLVEFSRSTTFTGNAGLVGQETDKVLAEFGYDDDARKALADEGVILQG